MNFRFVQPLNLNEVADRIVLAIRGNEKFAIIPGYLQLMLILKWYVVNVIFLELIKQMDCCFQDVPMGLCFGFPSSFGPRCCARTWISSGKWRRN